MRSERVARHEKMATQESEAAEASLEMEAKMLGNAVLLQRGQRMYLEKQDQYNVMLVFLVR
mgnify:CR=1 FL=1